LKKRPCRCSCGDFEGPFATFEKHLAGCKLALACLSLRILNVTKADIAERQARAESRLGVETTDLLRLEMLGAAPALVHRVPATIFEEDAQDKCWWSPPFSGCGWSFSLCISTTGITGSRSFCLVQHGHSQRLRCSIYFARRPGLGFVERRVCDWPIVETPLPWGPTVRWDELLDYRQADGTLLLMVHVNGLAENGKVVTEPMIANESIPLDCSAGLATPVVSCTPLLPPPQRVSRKSV